MSNLIQDALKFATQAHNGQVRKYTGESYINHPISVAKLVEPYDCDQVTISAALLHDVVEDTKFTLHDISKNFGINVAEIVRQLTDISKLSDGNRAIRKEIDRRHLSFASPTAKTIKLADLIDNSESIIEYGEKFAPVFMAEKKALLKVLTEGNSILFKKATLIVEKYFKNNS